MMGDEVILVIRHGALGDFVQSIGPFQAIRQQHPDAKIILLTAPFLKKFAEMMPFFDEVWIDERPRWTQVLILMKLMLVCKKANFRRVYDLQTSGRTALYFKLQKWLLCVLGGNIAEWSSHVPGCAFAHTGPERARMHTLDRQKQQLMLAGILNVPTPHFDWIEQMDVPPFELKKPFALIVPQASAHRPEKCYPLPEFRVLMDLLISKGVVPVVIGSQQDLDVDLGLSQAQQEKVMDLRGKTQLEDLVLLGRHGALAIGNDTGPMHMFAIAGCPVVTLFSYASDPSLCAPRGDRVVILRAENFTDLPATLIWEYVEGYFAKI
jgi:ADP-heptose:LPS heptosyltransferase